MNHTTYVNKRVVSREEDTNTNMPDLFKGYTVDRNVQHVLCTFYDYCIADKGFAGQMKCVMKKKLYCRNDTRIKECNEKLSVG